MSRSTIHKIILASCCAVACSAGYSQSPSNNPFLDWYHGKRLEAAHFNWGRPGPTHSLLLRNIPRAWVSSYSSRMALSSGMLGYDGLGGDFNVGLKRAGNFEYDMAASLFNEWEGNMRFRIPISKKYLSTGMFLNKHRMRNKVDNNGDGFLDTPLKDRTLLINNWYANRNKFSQQFSLLYMNLAEDAGQVDFNPDTDYMTTNNYGTGITGKQFSLTSRSQLRLDERNKRLNLNMSFSDHSYDAFYGIRKHDAHQSSFDAAASFFNNRGMNKYDVGLAYRLVNFKEQLDSLVNNRLESVVGTFVDYHAYVGPRWRYRLSLRADYHNLFDWIYSPKLKVDYKASNNTFLTLFGRSGFRYPNVLTENARFLVSSRGVEMATDLKPERGWVYGIGFLQNLGNTGLQLNYARRDYTNQVVVDIEQDANLISIYNLNGRSWSNSFEIGFKTTAFNENKPRNRRRSPKIGFETFYRFEDVKVSYTDDLKSLPLYSRNRFYLNSFMYIRGLVFNIGGNWLGPQRIPANNPTGSNGGSASVQSPRVSMLDAKVSIPLAPWFQLYVGVDNMMNNTQDDPYLSADDPFGQEFDGGLQWGPVLGRRWYGGLSINF